MIPTCQVDITPIWMVPYVLSQTINVACECGCGCSHEHSTQCANELLEHTLVLYGKLVHCQNVLETDGLVSIVREGLKETRLVFICGNVNSFARAKGTLDIVHTCSSGHKA